MIEYRQVSRFVCPTCGHRTPWHHDAGVTGDRAANHKCERESK